MRILILSCNTGEGHNSAAKAIAEVLEQRQIDYKIEDALSCFSKEISDLVCKSHVMLYKKAPKIFGAGYRYIEEHFDPDPDVKSTMFELLAKGSEKLYELVCSGGYSSVICVHVFAAMMLTRAMENHSCNLKTYFVSTDYTCCPGAAKCNMDRIFVPHEMLVQEFIDCGVSEIKLAVSGIPVKQAFFNQKDKIKARETLSLPQDKKIVLLACGSMGCGPIKSIAEQLLEELPDDVITIAVCGNNKKLYNKLADIAEGNPAIRVLGYTQEMPLLLDAVDLIITKPGGLSSTEAASKGLPMVFVNAVPGCETHNLNFFTEYGFAVTDESVEGLVRLVNSYIQDNAALENASEKLKQNFRLNGAVAICDQVISDAESD